MALVRGDSGEGGEGGESVLQLAPTWMHGIYPALQEDLKSGQTDLEALLVKIIASPEPYPSPGRPIRNLVAKCLTALYSRGETRTLFDTLQSFLKIAGDTKAPHKDVSRM